ncbi:MAG TPA: hypothetical protein VFO60_00935 [Candidatus Dormibacteraeota bacterium]|nr:hypothetical protein [Candidatus Dormibacteraeota bacterium]
MSIRDVAGKALGFGLVAAGAIGGGFLILYGPHANAFADDKTAAGLAIFLFLTGLGVAGFGLLTILVELREKREEDAESKLHITPRPGPLGPPPPWGMGDVGRVGGATHEVGGAAGGGGPRLMSVHVSSIDGPIVVGLLLIATLVALILKAHFGGLDVSGP